MKLKINGKEMTLDDRYTDDLLLWGLRDGLGLKGTRFGCGIGQCGACTVHIDGEPVRSCQTPISMLDNAEIRTIEGVSDQTNGQPHPVQQAFIDHQVPQCGYCMSGQMMSAVALLEQKPNPTDAEIDAAMRGNLCRCGTYVRIRQAIHAAAGGAA